NGKVFLKLVKSNVKLTGGAITHMGMALMLLGILFSSGYSKVISINHSGLIYSKDADNAFNTENILLWRGDPTPMRDYTLTYKGSRFEVKGFPGYADAKDLFITDNDLDAIVMNDLV